MASPLESRLPEQNRTTVPHTMDDIIFYQPALALKSQSHRRLHDIVTPETVSGASITSLSVRQTTTQLNQQDGISNAQMTNFRDGSDLSLTSRFPDQHPAQGTRRDLESQSLHL